MRVQDAASYRPVPVSADRSGRMDEPTTAVRNRLPARGESRAPGATGPPAPSPHQRSASATIRLPFVRDPRPPVALAALRRYTMIPRFLERREPIMSQCIRLFQAQDINAFYST